VRNLYATQLDIDASGREPADLVLELTDIVEEWIAGSYRRNRERWGEVDLTFPSDGSTIHPSQGHDLSSTMEDFGAGSLSSLVWAHPDRDRDDVRWVTRVQIARREEQVQFHFVLGLELLTPSIRPTSQHFGRPRVVSTVLERFPTRVGAWAVPTEVRRLPRDEVESFVEGVLLHPSRTLPVVVISPSVWSDQPVLDPDRACRELLGSAEVVLLENKFASFELTDHVGKPFTVYDGAVRVYWPGFQLSDDPRRHPLYLGGTIREFRDRRGGWEKDFAKRLAGMSVLAMARSSLVREVRREAAAAAAEEARAKAMQARSDGVAMEEVLEELEAALVRAEQAESRAEEAETKAEQLEYAATWSDAAPDGDEEQAAVIEVQREFRTVAEAVGAARRETEGRLVFLDTALESAEASPFNRPNEVYRLLISMSKVAAAWQEGEGALGTSWENAVAEHGFEFKPRISETTRGQWGNEYEFTYKGVKHLFEQHVTLGSKSPETCLSAHFLRDDEHFVLVVGWCGRHLRNTKT